MRALLRAPLGFSFGWWPRLVKLPLPDVLRTPWDGCGRIRNVVITVVGVSGKVWWCIAITRHTMGGSKSSTSRKLHATVARTKDVTTCKEVSIYATHTNWLSTHMWWRSKQFSWFSWLWTLNRLQLLHTQTKTCVKAFEIAQEYLRKGITWLSYCSPTCDIIIIQIPVCKQT